MRLKSRRLAALFGPAAGLEVRAGEGPADVARLWGRPFRRRKTSLREAREKGARNDGASGSESPCADRR